jgi:membrane-bound lytic murein transglycosylase D
MKPLKKWKEAMLVCILCANIVPLAFSQINLDELDTLTFVGIDSAYAPDFDYVPDFTAQQVRERLASISDGVELTFSPQVFSFVDYLTVRNREYARMILRRQSLYLPVFEKYLAQHNMPDELKYLSIVESGLNPKALSRSGALGLWQFIPSTGKYLGLKIDPHFDERMHIEKSTDAACKYLKTLYNSFGNWQLALAAYNCGPGVVGRAIKRSGKRTFAQLYPYLPSETRSYVPQFIAITYLMNFHKEHNLYPDYYEYPMAYDTVSVKQYVNLEVFCKYLGICTEDLMALNPELKRNYIPNSGSNYVLKYPSDRSDYFRNNKQIVLDSSSVGVSQIVELNKKLNSPLATTGSSDTKIYHKVKSGQTLSAIANKYHVTVLQLKKWNNISGHKLKQGQKLVIWKKRKIPAKAHEYTKYPVPRKKYYQVKQGDTIWSISKKYDNVSVEEIKRLNHIQDNEIQVGQRLIIVD